MVSAFVKDPSSRYFSMFSPSFFLFFGLSTTTADQKCLSPKNLSSIKDCIAPARHMASRDFLLTFRETTPLSNKRSSTDENGRLNITSSMAAIPKPLIVVRGGISFPSRTSQDVPEVLMSKAATL